jgi:signal transduction histidine kinase
MLDQAYPYLILTGSTIGLVLLYLWQRAREVSRLTLELIRRNEQHQFDTLAFLRNNWDLLSQAGLRGMSWRLDWYGAMIEGSNGKLDGALVEREVRIAEINLQLRIYQSGRRGEQRYFNEALIETLLLLLRTDLSIKVNATNAAFTQMAKLNLFLQHDMKNIGQFIQLMADQISKVPEGKEKQILAHLHQALPLVLQRADRIVRTLTLGQSFPESQRPISLEQKLDQLCRLHGLDFQLAGSATVCLPESLIDNALDNILKNYSDLALRNPQAKPALQFSLHTEGAQAHVGVSADHGAEMTHIERLFEPFWTQDPAGLGIGLYQAKQLIERCGGTLVAGKTGDGRLLFQIMLPRNTGWVRNTSRV